MIISNFSSDNELNVLAIKYQKRFPKSNFIMPFHDVERWPLYGFTFVKK